MPRGFKQVEFLGEIHEYPDTWNDFQIGNAITAYMKEKPASEVMDKPDDSREMRTERLNVGAVTEYVAKEEQFPELPTLNLNERMFVDTIAEIETGGLSNKFIRTKVNGSGSSAFGRYQITHGLLSGTIAQSPDLFEEAELRAAQELVERQEISLAVGGSDIPKYQAGGERHHQAKLWASKYGYDDVNEFLTAFDYGGDFGLGDNAEFQNLYEGFARKMLLKELKGADNDPIEAASRWHGGLKWRKAKSRKTTDKYREKYKAIIDKRSREVEL